MGWLLIVFLWCAIAAGLLWIAIALFRRGRRDRFVTDGPYLPLAFWTFGFQVLLWLVDVARGEAERDPLLMRTKFAAILFAAGMLIWIAGFIHGRIRAARRRGVLGKR